MLDFATVAAYGPYVIIAWLLFSFVERVAWPFFVKQVWPQWSKRARAEAEARRKAEEAEEDERRRREDRLFHVLEANTRALASLETTLEAMSAQFTAQLARQSEIIHAQGLDIAGLYGHLQKPRPSQQRKAAESDASAGA